MIKKLMNAITISFRTKETTKFPSPTTIEKII